MTITHKLFLYENNAQKNLEMLANFTVSISDNTNCTTESVYKKLPKSHISDDRIREFCIVSAQFTALAIPFIFVAKKSYECASLFWELKFTESVQCRQNILESLAQPVNIMTYISLLSMGGVLGVGAYAVARRRFQDNTREERFESLDRVYSEAAALLEIQYKTSQKKDREKIVETAIKISDNAKLINASLREAVRLSAPQADLLTAKISHAANLVIFSEERAKTSPAALPIAQKGAERAPQPARTE